jgi:glycosyltransferase involved in cell wall biosynthesis
MAEKKRILFVNDEMRMGGVARVLNTLMAALPKDQYEVDLLVLHQEGMLLKEIPEGVHLLNSTPFFKPVDESIDQLMKSGNVPQLASKIRLVLYMKTGMVISRIRKERKKIITKPYDVEVAAKEGFCTIFTAAGDSRRKINWVLTDYSVCNYSQNHMPLVQKALQKIDLNVADSTQALTAYEQVFGVSNGISIHNLMDVDKVKQGMKAAESDIIPTDTPNLITVARFHPQKGLDRLLEASALAYHNGYRHTLYLIGGGEEEEKLKKQAEGMEQVKFLGYRQNPYRDVADCDLFVLPSLYEGFATIVNESLLAGTPVLMTDVSGAREQIVSEECGWVVENSQAALNEGLLKALKNPQALKQMKQNLQTYTYPNEQILKQFMDIL